MRRLANYAYALLWDSRSQSSSQSTTGQITPDFPRIHWHPTEATATSRYVGDIACAGCHPSIVKTQLSTPMAHGSEAAAQCRILIEHPDLRFQRDGYSYEIRRRGAQSIYSVTDGKTTLSAPILYGFGLGVAGQTYVYELGGRFYESRVSFYNEIEGLDLTIGAPHRQAPKDVQEALGRPMSPDEEHDCFACHTTGLNGQPRLDQLPTAGITCEGCHGPGAAHIAAMKAGQIDAPQIFNPGKLNAGDVLDFCGSCHRTAVAVATQALSGIDTVRMQPYRLSNSACFDPEDSRIGCLGCHDPHQQLVTDDAAYDVKCLACHPVGGRGATAALTAANSNGRPASAASPKPGAKACPVAAGKCVSCHMPKYELPGAHHRFTDHYIRVVKPGAPYPDL